MPISTITEATSSSLSISSEAWEKVVSFPPDPSVGTNIIEPGYTRSCTRISKLM